MSRYKIKDLFNIEKGTLQSSKNVEGKYDFITASSDWKTHETFTHDCEALIFAMGASGSLGRTHYVNGKFITSDLCFILTPKEEFKDKLELKLYYHYFNFNREEIVKATATGTSKKAINLANFSKYEIDYVENQKELLRKIEIVLPKVTELEKIIMRNSSLLESLSRKLFEYGVKGKLVPQNPCDEPAKEILESIRQEKLTLVNQKKLKREQPLPGITDIEKPFDIPNGWEWVRLGEVTNILRGSSPRPKGDKRYFSETPTDYNWITISDITSYSNNNILYKTREFLTSEGSTKSTYVSKDEVIIAVSGSTTGKSCLTGIDGYIYDGLAVIRLFSSGISERYLSLFMKYLYDFLNNSKEGSAFPNINTDKLKKVVFPLPPINEQNLIVEKVEQLLKLANELQSKVVYAKKESEYIMKSVLQEVFGNV
ncbi:restriction endonuclease subunit S [Ferdinandcohnia quinoae]|uniref:Restriction endonuclease subunit S n=1 Tax=Fredinandcohnia quinoae TaxID=2918902 RepID=A0AAW5E7Y6_9BACI|nr:restriction endonuclease subunit S [Fredinandcohnia sp. SECRCQ15]MCH1626121.1 restriction endonuclease subunit S [Fredinandcohnia sp. SECRCQ15]